MTHRHLLPWHRALAIALCAWSSGCASPARQHATAALATPSRPATIAWWNTPRRGANFFNRVETDARFRAAAAAGIGLVRLAPDKWETRERDFLLGDADAYRGLVPADLARLRAVLDLAHARGVRVVLTMLSLPGCRWSQNNGDVNDLRLYREERFQAQAIAFWRELAGALRGHPAIVGYNLLNEPRPERAPDTRGFDLSGFYARVVAAVRTVDATTPIVLDASDDASPAAFERLRPIDDPAVLYALHMYEPWPFIDHRNRRQIRYPGPVPDDDAPGGSRLWNADTTAAWLDHVARWQRAHGVPSSRIFAEEFGCPRTHDGAAQWLTDVLDAIEHHGWHWAFYSFREDTWDAMDYELGTAPLPPGYWSAVEAGHPPALVRSDTPLWRTLARRFANRRD
jgi:hypothetical protein